MFHRSVYRRDIYTPDHLAQIFRAHAFIETAEGIGEKIGSGLAGESLWHCSRHVSIKSKAVYAGFIATAKHRVVLCIKGLTGLGCHKGCPAGFHLGLVVPA